MQDDEDMMRTTPTTSMAMNNDSMSEAIMLESDAGDEETLEDQVWMDEHQEYVSPSFSLRERRVSSSVYCTHLTQFLLGVCDELCGVITASEQL